MRLARQHLRAKDQTQRADEIRVVVVAGPAGLLGVVSQLGSFLMTVDRLDRAVDVEHVGLRQERFPDAALLLREPGVPCLRLPSFERAPHAVLGDHLRHAQHFRPDAVVAQGVDVRIARVPVENRQNHGSKHVPVFRGVVARVGHRRVLAKPIHQTAGVEVLCKIDHGARGRHLRVPVPLHLETSGQTAHHQLCLTLHALVVIILLRNGVLHPVLLS